MCSSNVHYLKRRFFFHQNTTFFYILCVPISSECNMKDEKLEEALLHNLKRRFNANIIYVCVKITPQKTVYRI